MIEKKKSEEKKIVEYIELEQERKWKYLSRYYEVSSAFYQIKDRVVDEKDVKECIKNFKKKPSPKIRKELKLEKWHFTLDEVDEGVRNEYYSFKQDEKGWKEVMLPHSINHAPKNPVRYGRTSYPVVAQEKGGYWNIWKGEYASWYKKRIKLEKIGDDEIAYLGLDSVNLITDVWVNENPVMMGHLGLFPFKIEISEELNSRRDKEAVVALKVGMNASNIPWLFYNGLQGAYTNPSYQNSAVKDHEGYDEAWTGIAGDITLWIVNRRHIEDVFIFTEELVEGEASLKCRVELRNASWKRFSGKVRVEVSKWYPGEREAVEMANSVVTVLPMNDVKVDIGFVIKDPDLWSVESPNLYLTHVVLMDEDGKDIDDVFESFGVRTIKMRGSHFYLNNKKIVPRGTHDLTNYFRDSSICPSDRSIVMDILLHKKMNATCSRLPSDTRIHYKRIAEYADQLGFMLSWVGYFETWTVHPEMEMYARRDTRALVRSLRNSPSIIVWEMGDEPLMLIHHHRRFRWYDQVYNLTEEEDQSRPIIPAGYYCNELVELIMDYPERDLSIEEKRRKVLEDYHVFNKELSPWDFHHCPYLPERKPRAINEVIDRVKEALGGQKPTIFTEFGIDGIPKLENVLDVYGKFRWEEFGVWPLSREKKDISYYGKTVSQEDWQETQAAQALVLSNIIGLLRESPKYFAGYYLVTLVDSWTFYWGVVDANFNAKLSYFVVQNCYKPIYISGLHGTTVLEKRDKIEITVSNLGETLRGCSLRVTIKDEDGSFVKEKSFSNLMIKGNVSVSKGGALDITELSSGLFSIEYVLTDQAGTEMCKHLELFFLQ
ncbi:MAG: hypothetical protein JSV25_02945 [Spirochaetota bacterium]|nr:MAG: hypothetical protein JSV25_02945 [Spirochaetota bacterium]